MALQIIHYQPHSSASHSRTSKSAASLIPLSGGQGRGSFDEGKSLGLTVGAFGTSLIEEQPAAALTHEPRNLGEKPITRHGDEHSTLASVLHCEGVPTPTTELTLDWGHPTTSVSSTEPLGQDDAHHEPRASHTPCLSHAEDINRRAMDECDESSEKHNAEAQKENGREASHGKNDQDMVDATDVIHGHESEIAKATSAGEQSHPTSVTSDGEYEILEITGKEVMNGELYYMVKWKPTLVLVNEINAPGLIRAFEARYGTGTKQPVKGGRVTKTTTAPLRKLGKPNARGRGRPRKHELGR